MTLLFLALIYAATTSLVYIGIGSEGLIGEYLLTHHLALKYVLFMVFMIHVTITAMSLSFHRYHTHRGIIINKYLDGLMQIWLWVVTSMSKLDWVSIHLYHHAHSDKEKDPHSPVHKGLWRIMLGGAWDYSEAKHNPEVLVLRKTLKTNALERFLDKHKFLGPLLMAATHIILLGPFWGSIMAVSFFAISPIFAVGGVNALAHYFGYRNHKTTDNSRNLGFVLPLNFLVCGEMDHNNHHRHPRSCSFRHKWYEFDIGYFYIKLLKRLKLVVIREKYTPTEFKKEIAHKIAEILERDKRFYQKLEEHAHQFNISVEELKISIRRYVAGEKIKLEGQMKLLAKEVQRTLLTNQRLGLSY
jgi:stearoyl-CoA desaturase (delta-9 desaturase)